MITEISFDSNRAKRVDAPRSIAKTGSYIGTITQVEMSETKNGATKMDIAFLADDGSLTFLPMFLTTNEGQEAFSMGLIHAMMAILKIDGIKAVPGKVFNRNKETHDGFRVTALEKKRIGLLIQRVNDFYEGKETYQLNVVSVFDPETNKTAHELLEGKEATNIEKRLATLHDRDSKRLQDYRMAQNYGSNNAVDEDPFF